MKYYYIDINDNDLGLQAISLVDKPAIEQDFLLFNDEHICFAKDDEKQIISGPALIAEMPIYRRNAKGEEFYVIFNKETIAKLVERYSKNGLFNIVNLQHDHSLFTENAILVESYLWEQIKNGNDLNGFSVEIAGHLVEKFESEKQDTPEDEINKLIDEILEK